MEQTLEQIEQKRISDEAFRAADRAVTAEQHIAASELHTAAMETGLPQYRLGHQRAISTCLQKAKAKRNPELAEGIYRRMQAAAQIGR